MALLLLIVVVIVVLILALMLVDTMPGEPRLKQIVKAVCILIAILIIVQRSGLLSGLG